MSYDLYNGSLQFLFQMIALRSKLALPLEYRFSFYEYGKNLEKIFKSTETKA
jgi:hypothetical protein